MNISLDLIEEITEG